MATELLTPSATRTRRLNASTRLMDWILWQVALIGPMSVDELVQISGVSRGRVREAVSALLTQDLLIRIGHLVIDDDRTGNHRKGSAYHHLSPTGWSLAMTMIDSHGPAKEGQTSKGSGLPHMAGTNRSLIALYQLIVAEQRRLESAESEEECAETGVLGWMGYRFASRFYERWLDGRLMNPTRIRPDAMLGVAFRDQQYELRVELDRGTEGSKVLAEKVRRYDRELKPLAGFQRRSEGFPVNILWVIDDPKEAIRAGTSRVDQIVNVVYQNAVDPATFEQHLNDQEVVGHRHWVTSLSQLESATSLDEPIWYDPWEDEPEARPSTIWVPTVTPDEIVDPVYPRRMLLK